MDTTKKIEKLTKEELYLRNGHYLYQVRGCVDCHGRSGDGKGRRSYRLDPKARDFKNLQAYAQGHSIEAIKNTIKLGITNRISGMPMFPYLKDEDLESLAHYLVYLRTNEVVK